MRFGASNCQCGHTSHAPLCLKPSIQLVQASLIQAAARVACPNVRPGAGHGRCMLKQFPSPTLQAFTSCRTWLGGRLLGAHRGCTRGRQRRQVAGWRALYVVLLQQLQEGPPDHCAGAVCPQQVVLLAGALAIALVCCCSCGCCCCGGYCVSCAGCCWLLLDLDSWLGSCWLHAVQHSLHNLVVPAS